MYNISGVVDRASKELSRSSNISGVVERASEELYSSSNISGVVERASKELSRRFSSLAARTRRGSTQKHERLVEIPETDR